MQLRAIIISLAVSLVALSCSHDAYDLLFDQKKTGTTVTPQENIPVVSNVTATNNNGTFSIGSPIHIQIVFSLPVTVTGTPRLTLSTGNPATTSVNYISGSGTSTLEFTYTVVAGNSSPDLDYNSATALSLNGGTIRSIAGIDAILTLPAPAAAGSLGANKNLVIDSTAATVTNITSLTGNGSFTTAGSISIQITFSAAVTVTGTPQLILSTGSPTTTNVNYVSGSGSATLNFTYTVAAGNYSTDLDYASINALILNGGTIMSGVPAADLTLFSPGATGSLGANKALVIDAVAPTVVSMSSPQASMTTGTLLGANIDITITFSKPVTVAGSQLNLSTGQNAVYLSGTGTSSITYRYAATLQAANPLDYTSTTALTGGTIQDSLANAADRTLPAPGAGSLLFVLGIILNLL